MNLLKWLFGKKKVENQPTKEVVIPKSKTFRHITKYQSDSKWHEESKREKCDDENRRRDSVDVLEMALIVGAFGNNDDSSSNSSSSDTSSNGFDSGFGGGEYSGGGSSGSWDSDSSSSSSYDSGSSSYDSGSSSYDSGSSDF